MLRTHCTENRDLRSQPRCFRCIIENFEVSNSGPEWPKLELRFFFTGPDLYQKSVIHYILLEKRHLTCEKHETNVVKLSSLKNGSMKTKCEKNEWNKVCNYTHIYIYIRFNICKMYQACWFDKSRNSCWDIWPQRPRKLWMTQMWTKCRKSEKICVDQRMFCSFLHNKISFLYKKNCCMLLIMGSVLSCRWGSFSLCIISGSDQVINILS